MKYIVVTGGKAPSLFHISNLAVPCTSGFVVQRTFLPSEPDLTFRSKKQFFTLFSPTSGVVSGLGKGVTASSIGVLLKAGGWRVTSIKIDPYINIDAGTMSPFEHGEVFVLDDGGEADLDLGNYERFIDSTLTRDHNITTGKIYQSVIAKERKGEYLGKTVQASRGIVFFSL